MKVKTELKNKTYLFLTLKKNNVFLNFSNSGGFTYFNISSGREKFKGKQKATEMAVSTLSYKVAILISKLKNIKIINFIVRGVYNRHESDNEILLVLRELKKFELIKKIK